MISQREERKKCTTNEKCLLKNEKKRKRNIINKYLAKISGENESKILHYDDFRINMVVKLDCRTRQRKIYEPIERHRSSNHAPSTPFSTDLWLLLLLSNTHKKGRNGRSKRSCVLQCALMLHKAKKSVYFIFHRCFFHVFLKLYSFWMCSSVCLFVWMQVCCTVHTAHTQYACANPFRKTYSFAFENCEWWKWQFVLH